MQTVPGKGWKVNINHHFLYTLNKKGAAPAPFLLFFILYHLQILPPLINFLL